MQMLNTSSEANGNGSKKYVGGGIQPQKSEYQKVASLRKSRGSTEGFVTIDLEGLTGNTASYQPHIKRSSKDSLAHMISLRNYKNETSYNPQQPWQWPAVKHFTPREQYTTEKSDVNGKLPQERSNWYVPPIHKVKRRKQSKVRY